MRSVKELKNIRGKRVLVRVDFNVHLVRNKVADDTKIAKAVPTIKWLVQKGAKVILMTHLGRPTMYNESGIRNKELGVVVKRLSELVKKSVPVVEKWDFKTIDVMVQKMKPGQILMLPNLRLHPGEEQNSKKFAEALAQLGEFYVNEAFGVSHRTHASLVRVPTLLPGYAGLQLIKEVEVLNTILREAKGPLLVLMGGGKIADKMAMLKTMARRADNVLLGGALATHFYKAMGYDVGASHIEHEGVSMAKKLLVNKKIVLPKDVVIGTEDGDGARLVQVSAGQQDNRTTGQHKVICSKPYAIWDIGPKTILEYATYIKAARTLIWNGPLGRYEVQRYCHGTRALGRLFAARSRGKAFGLLGGGETIDAARQTGMIEYVDFISTGGGAMLEFLGGKKLPGIEALAKSPLLR